MMVSNSMGVNQAQAHLSTPAVIGPLDPGHDRDAQFLSRVAQARRSRTFFCSRLKNDSIAALSQDATLPIEPTRLWAASSRRSFLLRNCDPLSEWTMQPFTFPRTRTALRTAPDHESDAFILESIE